MRTSLAVLLMVASGVGVAADSAMSFETVRRIGSHGAAHRRARLALR